MKRKFMAILAVQSVGVTIFEKYNTVVVGIFVVGHFLCYHLNLNTIEIEIGD